MIKIASASVLALALLSSCGASDEPSAPGPTLTPAPTLTDEDPITITQPTEGALVQRTFVARGLAEVFEGTVIIRLTDSRGEEFLETFTTAASGVERSPWEIELTIPDGVEGEVTLTAVAESAEDGSDAFTTSVTFRVA